MRERVGRGESWKRRELEEERELEERSGVYVELMSSAVGRDGG